MLKDPANEPTVIPASHDIEPKQVIGRH